MHIVPQRLATSKADGAGLLEVRVTTYEGDSLNVWKSGRKKLTVYAELQVERERILFLVEKIEPLPN